MALKSKLVLTLVAVIAFSYMYENYQSSELKSKEDARQAKAKTALIEKFITNKSSILQDINKQIELGDYRNALKLISNWKSIGDKDINDVFKIARSEVLTADLKLVPTEQYQNNLNLYTELAKLNPETAQYNEKIAFYTSKKNEEKIKTDAINARKKLIESAFSPWDGSHLALERVVISSMNDPDSYEHVSTNYIDYGDYVFVLTKFRGKNAFGGLVVNSISANAKVSGEIIEIID
jgi:hypothetical protein